jgi:hypothetical protein
VKKGSYARMVAVLFTYSTAILPKTGILPNTGIAIPPNFWNTKKLCITDDLPKEYGRAEELNDSLLRMMRHTEDVISIANKRKLSDPRRFVKEKFNAAHNTINFQKENDPHMKNPRINLDIFFQIDDYIQSKIKKVCKDMPRSDIIDQAKSIYLTIYFSILRLNKYWINKEESFTIDMWKKKIDYALQRYRSRS